MTATSYWPADRSSPVLDTTVGGVLRAAAGRAPDRVALIAADRQWTYAQLNHEAERAARALSSRFTPGDRIAVWAGNSADWVLLEFAAAMAGLTLVMVNPAYGCEELAHVLRHSGVSGNRCRCST
jgi:fatty-acyl-CoA synthase